MRPQVHGLYRDLVYDHEFCVIDHSELGSCALWPVQGSQGMAEAAARGLEAEPFPLHISSEVLDDLGQSPVTSRSHLPALDASDVLAGVPDDSFALFAAAR